MKQQNDIEKKTTNQNRRKKRKKKITWIQIKVGIAKLRLRMWEGIISAISFLASAAHQQPATISNTLLLNENK